MWNLSFSSRVFNMSSEGLIPPFVPAFLFSHPHIHPIVLLPPCTFGFLVCALISTFYQVLPNLSAWVLPGVYLSRGV